MLSRIPDEKIRIKYERTIQFLEKNKSPIAKASSM